MKSPESEDDNTGIRKKRQRKRKIRQTQEKNSHQEKVKGAAKLEEGGKTTPLQKKLRKEFDQEFGSKKKGGSPA